jgi:hypothetical protein
MNNEIKDLLDKIEEEEKQYGDSVFAKNGKANEKEIEYFKKWIVKYSNKGFPEYIDFVKIINGLNFNGLFLYSLNKKCEYNIYESNETWWDDDEEQKRYIFIGDNDISWFCLNKDNGKYYILDKPGGTIMNEYETFAEIIIKALKISLDIENE